MKRLALNMDQVEQYEPPPNPAKLTDSRATSYIELHGDESWELDALEPTVIADLIRDAVAEYRDDDLWNEAVEREERERLQLQSLKSNWEAVAEFLRDQEGEA